MINSPRVEKSAKIVKRYRKDKNLGENQNETQTSDWIWTYECEDDVLAENSNSAGVNGKLSVASDANQNQSMPNDSTLVHDSTGMSVVSLLHQRLIITYFRCRLENSERTKGRSFESW